MASRAVIIHKLLHQRAVELQEKYGLPWDDAMMQSIGELENARNTYRGQIHSKALQNAAWELLYASERAIRATEDMKNKPPWLIGLTQVVRRIQRSNEYW